MHRALLGGLWLASIGGIAPALCGGAMAIGGIGCASSEPAAVASPQTAGAAASTGSEQPPATAPLSGLWVEFWALEGHADTQRYALFEDGRFGWCAAREGEGKGARRWGRWKAEGETLVLQVQGRDHGPACRDDACRQRHEPPVEERLQLGPCPPNEEARALDSTYRCISIAGQAFWRRAQADDPAMYFPN
jgi:hypothetical protein